MKTVFLGLVLCLVPLVGSSQSTLVPPKRDGSASYGSGSSSPTITGSSANVRSRSFSGSGYFTSSSDSVDTAFALRLGNGVTARAGSAAIEVQAVPEPSTVMLSLVAGAVFLAARRWRSASRPARG